MLSLPFPSRTWVFAWVRTTLRVTPLLTPLPTLTMRRVLVLPPLVRRLAPLLRRLFRVLPIAVLDMMLPFVGLVRPLLPSFLR